tara:strand:- start:3233 stop:5701 length:2469 start_codon:yes stop_codon:yes gene_type:complete
MYQNVLEKQLNLELEGKSLGKKRYQKGLQEAISSDSWTRLPSVRFIMSEAVEPVAKAFVDWRDRRRTGKPAFATHLIDVVESLNLEDETIAYLALICTLDGLSQSHPEMRVARSIGNSIQDEYRLRIFRAENPNYFKRVLESEHQKRNPRYRKKNALTWLLSRKTQLNLHDLTLDDGDKVMLGKILIHLIHRETGLVNIIPNYVNKKKTINMLVANPSALDWIEKLEKHKERIATQYMPCVVSPRDWQEKTLGGGYYTSALKGLRAIKLHKKSGYQDLDNVSMPLVYEALNQMQQTQFAINLPIFQTMERAFESGDEWEGIPSKDPYQLPQCPYPNTQKKTLTDEQKVIWDEWAKPYAMLMRKNNQIYSRRLQFVRGLQMARDLMQHKKFNYVAQCDYRGRYYLMHNFLHPQGPDWSKALMQSAVGMKVTDEEQINALAVAGANLYGFDKGSIKQRIGWVEHNTPAIVETAKHPFDCKFWTEADEPWQFLAFCKEWKKYQSNGLGYKSNYWVHTDGSQNGIQHYSAILSDAETGFYCNLTNTDKPQDLYQQVADSVIDELKHSNEPLARDWLESNLISRKMLKKVVMTFPYGGTSHMFTEYINSYVVEHAPIHWPFNNGVRITDAFKESRWLVTIVKKALETKVSAATTGMKWVKEVARKVIEQGVPLQWRTPSGFVVVQNYPEVRSRKIKTVLDGKLIMANVTDNPVGSKQDSYKVGNATPPNLIHSLDASHLTLTLKKCRDQGLNQVTMIHDSYGSLVAQMPLMQKLLRESFVDMYNEWDVCDEFLRDASMVVPEGALPSPPTKGDLDINSVKDSPFFFA